MKRWILASNSPRRRELLNLFDHPFEVIPADVNEDQHRGESPLDYVRRLSLEKAAAIAAEESGLILAADTIVVCDGQVLGKPMDEDHARQILEQLRGRTHQVNTSITLIDTETSQREEAICCTDVTMRCYSDAEIDTYIATGDPMDKAGAYGIQNPEFHPAEKLSGCFASVMGMPLCHLYIVIRRMGFHADLEIDDRCQQHLNYECPVAKQILNQAL